MKLSDVKMELTPSQLAERLKRLQNDNLYKDVTLTSHDTVVSAHKCVLATSSQFFELLFQQADRNQDLFQRSSFELVGLDAADTKHLEAVIDFLYSGVIYINGVNIVGIMKMADYLAIEELLDLCEIYIEQNVSKENCLKLYLSMKKTMNVDVREEGNIHNRRINELMKTVWDMVENNFYDYIIDNYDFLEMIPVEIETLLEKNFKIEKILSLAVRWMKTWPFGFSFAESLINIAHRQLNIAANLEQADASESHIVILVESLRQQVLLRTVPNSNSINMMRKLKEIHRVFDQNYVEPDIGDTNEETDIEENETGIANLENETIEPNEQPKLEDIEILSKIDNSEILKETEIIANKDDKVDNHESCEESEIEENVNGEDTNVTEIVGSTHSTNVEEKEGMPSNRIERDMNDAAAIDLTVRIKVNIENEQRELNVEPSSSETEKMDTFVTNTFDTSYDDIGHDKQRNVDTGNEISNNEKLIDLNHTETIADDEQVSKIEIPDAICDIYGTDTDEPSDVDNTVREVKVEEGYTDGAGSVEFIENEKLDGTERDISLGLEVAEAALQNRVTECLELMMKSIKTEEDGDFNVTRKRPVLNRKGKRRPKKNFSSLQDGDVKVWTKRNKSRIRGRKRNASASLSDIDGSDLEESGISVGVNEGESNGSKDMDDETTVDEKYSEEIEGSDDDIEDDDSEKVFDDLLKQTMGDEEVKQAVRKKMKKKHSKKSGYHECEICGQVYSQRYRLTQHMNKHLGIKPYKCVICLQTFTRTDHVVRHMRTQHADVSLYKCDECDEEFEKPNEVVSHSATHHQQDDKVDEPITEAEKEHLEANKDDSGKVQYTCKICSQIFKKRYQAREHVYMHTGEKPYKCEHCDLKFGRRENLATHVKNVHDGIRGEHRCSKCRRYFMKKENYDAHVAACEPSHTCEHCPMKFYRKTHLDNHKPVHDLTPQHQCPHCENKYRYRKHMLRHMRKDHLDEKETQSPCICDTCGVILKNKEALYRHKKVHKLPDKECDVCGKAFKDNTTLKDHKLMHTNIRDYQCEICSMLFARKGNLVRHQKRHRGERKYRCDICGMCFVANCDLTRHKNTHLGVKKFPCRYCGRKFGLKSKVVVHERTHTGERPYICREENCGKTFKQTGDRVRHEKKVHNLTFNKYMTLYELATGETEDIFKGAEPPKKPVLVPEPTCSETPPSDSSSISLASAVGSSMSSSVSLVSAVGSSMSSNVSVVPAVGASMSTLGYSQHVGVDNNSYIEETEMSKIFQRTVAAISQEAITNSGFYN